MSVDSIKEYIVSQQDTIEHVRESLPMNNKHLDVKHGVINNDQDMSNITSILTRLKAKIKQYNHNHEARIRRAWRSRIRHRIPPFRV